MYAAVGSEGSAAGGRRKKGTQQRRMTLWGEEKPRYRCNFLLAGNGTVYLVL